MLGRFHSYIKESNIKNRNSGDVCNLTECYLKELIAPRGYFPDIKIGILFANFVQRITFQIQGVICLDYFPKWVSQGKIFCLCRCFLVGNNREGGLGRGVFVELALLLCLSLILLLGFCVV